MTSTPENANLDGSDLDALREDIDALKAIPTEELLSPVPTLENELDAEPTDAIGSEDWDRPADQESLDQE